MMDEKEVVPDKTIDHVEKEVIPVRTHGGGVVGPPPPYLTADVESHGAQLADSNLLTTQGAYLSSTSSDPYNLTPCSSGSRLSSYPSNGPAIDSKPSSDLVPTMHPRAMLQKPIAIPAITKKFASPFIRAYPPILKQYQLPEEVFLPILDRINQIATASPPVVAFGVAGEIVGLVPTPVTAIVGMAMTTAADIGEEGISKGRTELYLRELNRDVFGPRGLKIKIAKLDTLAKLTGIPVLDAKGKLDKKASLLVPMDDPEQDMSLESSTRRLRALEPWIQPLKVCELPQVERPANILSKFAAKEQAKAHKEGEEKMLKYRAKTQQDYDKRTEKKAKKFDDKMQALDEKEQKAREKGDEKRVAKLEKERAKVLTEDETERRKIDKWRLEHDKEEDALRKAYFLIIRDLDEGDSRPTWRKLVDQL